MLRVALLGFVAFGCVELEKRYDPIQCPSGDLPPSLSPTAADLPGALYDPAAKAFPIVSIEIDEENWHIVCDNGRKAADAYNETLEPDHLWAVTKVTMGDQVVEDVGVRFMGRSTVTALFKPFDGEDEGDPVERCYAALDPESVRYDPLTGKGTFAYRPSFKFDFEQFFPGRDFFGQKRISLAGETGYRTLLDEWLPNQLFAAAGLPHVRAGHAALCINGTYRGLFMVVQEDDDQRWLDDHFDGMRPRDEGAFFKIDPFGPQTYHTDKPEEYASPISGEPYYDPRAGTTRDDTAALLDLFKVGNVDTAQDDAAFQVQMIGRLDVNWWLRVIAMEMALGDIDGMHANRNNYLIVQKTDAHWVPVRRDPDLSFYAWWRELAPEWAEWPGVSEVRGPSLLCLRPRYSGARPNCPDGSAPPNGPGFTARSVRRPAISARLLNAFRDDYLDELDDLLGTVLVAEDIRNRIEERAALIEPWIGSLDRPRLDPWGPDYFAWGYALRGEICDAGDPACVREVCAEAACVREVCEDGNDDGLGGCIDCRNPKTNADGVVVEECTLIQAVDFYLQQARAQVDGIRAGTIPSQCPRDEPETPSYQDLMACP